MSCLSQHDILYVRSWSCGGAFTAEHSELLTNEKWGWNVFVVVFFLFFFKIFLLCVCSWEWETSSEYCSVWHSRVNPLTGDETTPLLVVILLLIMSSLSVARARAARQCYLLKANSTSASWVFAFFFASHCVINYSELLIHSFTLEICFLWVFVCVFVCFSQPHSSKDYFLGLESEAEAKFTLNLHLFEWPTGVRLM